MHDSHGETVRIGAGGGRIVAVTRQRIDYIDMAGEERFVNLEECARAWGRWRDERRSEFLPLPGASEQGIIAWNARCVGQRGACDNPPWAAFMNERNTRFEFASYNALYQELLNPLQEAGWHTFDAN